MPQSKIELTSEAQAWADESIDGLGINQALYQHPALNRLCDWLGDMEEARLVGAITEEANWVHAPTLTEVIDRAWDSFEGTESNEVVLAHIRSTARAALEGDPGYWGDEYPVFIVADLSHSDGFSAVLGFRFRHFSEPVDWLGLFQNRSAFADSVCRDGHIASLAHLAAMSTADLLGEWGKRFL